MAPITTTLSDRTGIITINRPGSYNAINNDVLTRIEEVLKKWEHDASVQTVIFTGTGEKAFAAGADVTELSSLNPLEVLHTYPMASLFSRIEAFPKPTIAAVNGIALGGGFELALACDIRVASPQASFAFPELGLGIIPGAGGTQRLVEVAGRAVALHLILTRDLMPAERAFQLGVFAAVDDDPIAFGLTLAKTLSANGPTAQRLARDAIKNTRVSSGNACGHQVEQLSQAVALSGSESREGVMAFLEKRKPGLDKPILKLCLNLDRRIADVRATTHNGCIRCVET